MITTHRLESENLSRIQKKKNRRPLKFAGKLCNLRITLQFATENLAKFIRYNGIIIVEYQQWDINV